MNAPYVMINGVPYSPNHPKVLEMQNPGMNALTPCLTNYAPVNTANRIRQSQKPKLNKLELEYQVVLVNTAGVETETIVAQGMRFELGTGIWYKPDFTCIIDGRFTCIEVKGPHAFRGGFENLKVAARSYHWMQWILVWKKDGQWQTQTILP